MGDKNNNKPNKLKLITEKLAKGKYLIISAVIMFFFLLLMRSTDGNYLDMRFYYSTVDAYKVMSDLGAAGRQSYLNYLCLDFGFIVFFSSALLLIMGILLKKLKANDKWLVMYIFPVARAIFDIAENILIITMLRCYPGRFAFAYISGIATGSKWILMLITMLLIAILLFISLLNAMRVRKRGG